jgi:hypothetical protein
MRGKTVALICGGVPVSNSRYPYFCKTEKQLSLAPLHTYSADGTAQGPLRIGAKVTVFRISKMV